MAGKCETCGRAFRRSWRHQAVDRATVASIEAQTEIDPSITQLEEITRNYQTRRAAMLAERSRHPERFKSPTRRRAKIGDPELTYTARWAKEYARANGTAPAWAGKGSSLPFVCGAVGLVKAARP